MIKINRKISAQLQCQIFAYNAGLMTDKEESTNIKAN